ncbi:hypothetical protein K435DRAFT_833894 [Dendrothele bispora CBS 962.96]|uniref:Uncharacterized protein n=1 Tax=Dendrothele bispora (strain CBS 962.96) TaxID=1314807 RepID=A0A4V6T5R0_DENBC|nr:hypothetical protein K435DRAFT_833894 [Dendrothele bispora CBS 962.96]
MVLNPLAFANLRTFLLSLTKFKRLYKMNVLQPHRSTKLLRAIGKFEWRGIAGFPDPTLECHYRICDGIDESSFHAIRPSLFVLLHSIPGLSVSTVLLVEIVRRVSENVVIVICQMTVFLGLGLLVYCLNKPERKEEDGLQSAEEARGMTMVYGLVLAMKRRKLEHLAMIRAFCLTPRIGSLREHPNLRLQTLLRRWGLCPKRCRFAPPLPLLRRGKYTPYTARFAHYAYASSNLKHAYGMHNKQ